MTKIKTRTLLTGKIVDEASDEYAIILMTRCPKKWVLVDLETGEQYSTEGSAVGVAQTVEATYRQQTWLKATRRITIPRSRKNRRKS